MFEFLESPILFLLLGGALLLVAYLEMPPKKTKKSGRRVPFWTRLSRLSRVGWGCLIPGILLLVGAALGFLDGIVT